MCLIMIGKIEHIKKLELDLAWATNPHGAGIVIPSHKPDMIKGIMKWKQFDALIGKLDNALTVAIHFRMATHGEVSARNTHPFQLNKGSYLMHNGILQGLGSPGTKGLSDTAHLADILKRVKSKDRSLLLESLPGKYALVEKNVINAIGYFDELPDDIEVSNTYWMRSRFLTPTQCISNHTATSNGNYWSAKDTAWDND